MKTVAISADEIRDVEVIEKLAMIKEERLAREPGAFIRRNKCM